jgi:hypothetical protein
LSVTAVLAWALDWKEPGRKAGGAAVPSGVAAADPARCGIWRCGSMLLVPAALISVVGLWSRSPWARRYWPAPAA